MDSPQFQRLAESARPRIRLVIDGRSCEALAGRTVLTALHVLPAYDVASKPMEFAIDRTLALP